MGKARLARRTTECPLQNSSEKKCAGISQSAAAPKTFFSFCFGCFDALHKNAAYSLVGSKITAVYAKQHISNFNITTAHQEALMAPGFGAGITFSSRN